MFRRTTLLSLALVAGVLLSLVACGAPAAVSGTPKPTGGATPQSGGTLTWGVEYEPSGFNPILNDNLTELYVVEFSSDPLTYGGENYPTDLTPKLAESWETSADGLVWTIHLRKGVKWQDGTPFTADDVLFWAQAVQDPATKATWYSDRFFVDSKPYLFEKVNDTTVKITTAKPVPTLMHLICLALIQKKQFTDAKVANADMTSDKTNTQGPLGTGPFKIDSYKAGEGIVMSRFDAYWGGKPYLDKLVFRLIPDAQARLVALQSGDVDFANVIPQQVPKLMASKNLTVQTLKMDAHRMLLFNTGKPMLADKRTRQALVYAIDRQQLINTTQMGYGDVGNSPWNPIVTAYEAKPGYGYDVAKAKALLAEVGWKPGTDGILVADTVQGVDKGTRFSIKDRVELANDPIAAVLQSYWKAVGVEMVENVQDAATWAAENSGKAVKAFDVTARMWGWQGTDAGAYDRCDATGSTATSPMAWGNKQVADLFAQGKSAANQAAADVFYKQASAILWDELPAIPLYYETWVFGVNKKVHIEDAAMNPSLIALFDHPEKIWKEK